MSAKQLADLLFPGGATLFYSATFNDKPFAKTWLVPAGASAGDGLELQFFLELDPKAAGGGGSLVRQRGVLVLDAEGRPLRYMTEAQGARVTLVVDRDNDKVLVTLPDGSKPVVPLGGADFVVEANITGLDATFFALSQLRGKLVDGVDLKLFFLNQLIPIPYKLKQLGPGQWESSHDELLELGPTGLLERSHNRKQNVRHLREPAPPLPDWHKAPAGTELKDSIRYVPPENPNFTLEDVSIASPRGSIGGTLTLPKGASGPQPAVLFLSGTGSHDRHGMAGEIDLGTHEIIDFLSNSGLVGLRFDTRGAGTTQRDSLSASLKPIIEDARSCLAYLKGRREVDPARIMLIGHSQGGIVALVLGTEQPADVRAIALLATPGRPLHEILAAQIQGQAKAVGLAPELISKQLEDFHAFIEAVRAGKRFQPGEVPDHLVPLQRLTEWIAEYLAMQPGDLVGKLSCPVLVAQGAKDFQVTQRDAEVLIDAARAGGRDLTTAVLPDLDHLFKHTPGESKLEQYYDRSRHVDAGFLGVLRDWLLKVA